MLHPLDVSCLSFVGESLKTLRKEVGSGAHPPLARAAAPPRRLHLTAPPHCVAAAAAVLGFVGSPWTLATYIVEGKRAPAAPSIPPPSRAAAAAGPMSLRQRVTLAARRRGVRRRSSQTYMAFKQPAVLAALLDALADAIADYMIFQIDAGAQAVMLFDSWGGQLPPVQWDALSRPSIERMVAKVKAARPGVPLVLYANGSGGLLERMGATGVDAVGLDWSVDMADARRRLGAMPVQGNVDPAVLFAPREAVVDAVKACHAKAGPTGHIMNLGHGVLVGTPEENVAAFFDTVRSLKN